MELLNNPKTGVMRIPFAVSKSKVMLLAVPATTVVETVQKIGDTNSTIIIDFKNIVMGRGPQGF
jgi:predicted dinucleotide-binding enzyme